MHLLHFFISQLQKGKKGGQPSEEKEKKTNNAFEINNFAAVEINEAAGKKNLKGLKVTNNTDSHSLEYVYKH